MPQRIDDEDSDKVPPEPSSGLSGVGPWVEHARLVLDGLRTLFKRFDRLSQRLDEVPEQVREIVKEFLEPIAEKVASAEKKAQEASEALKYQDGRRDGRNEVIVHNEQKTSLWVVSITAIVAAVATAILTAAAEHFINGR